MGDKPQKGWDHFYGRSWPLETPNKDFHLAIGGGLDCIKWLKGGTEKGFISCNYFSTVFVLVKILLANLTLWIPQDIGKY